MLDLAYIKKGKIHLSDYDFQKDIERRLLFSQLSLIEFELLDEILFNRLTVPIWEIARKLEVPVDQLYPSIETLQQTGLISIQSDSIIVDKEIRKYFEVEISRFDEKFFPDLDFMQHILKKIPIHILPIWYSIPRTSNNIFQSIIDKTLETPLAFQKYFHEITKESIVEDIIDTLSSMSFSSVPTSTLKEKFSLDDYELQELILYLEFHFILFSVYRPVEDGFEEHVVLLKEWNEYLDEMNQKKLIGIPSSKEISAFSSDPFQFVNDLNQLLQEIINHPIPSTLIDSNEQIEQFLGKSFSKSPSAHYLSHLLQKASLLKFISSDTAQLTIQEIAEEWLSLDKENQAIFLYRHPSNTLLSFCNKGFNERNIHEAEKSIKEAFDIGWITFEEFFEKAFISINENKKIKLDRCGKGWKYIFPEYNEDEKKFIHSVIFENLYEVGVVQIGSFEKKDCFCVTPFGKTFFGS